MFMGNKNLPLFFSTPPLPLSSTRFLNFPLLPPLSSLFSKTPFSFPLSVPSVPCSSPLSSLLSPSLHSLSLFLFLFPASASLFCSSCLSPYPTPHLAPGSGSHLTGEPPLLCLLCLRASCFSHFLSLWQVHGFLTRRFKI